MNYVNNYRYTVTDRRGVRQVYPLGEADFTITYARQTDGKRYYKIEMPAEIIFNGVAFDNFYKIERSVYRCEYIDILIERRCTLGGHETWVPAWFTGRLLLNDGNFDVDKRKVIIKMAEISEYNCFDDNKSIEINLLTQIGVRRSVLTSPPNVIVDKIDKNDTYLNSQGGRCTTYAWDETYTAASVGFAVYYNQVHTDFLPGTGMTTYECIVNTSYAREKITVACGDPNPGPDWILLTDTCPGGERVYARPPSLYDCVTTDDTPGLGSYLNYTYRCKIVGDDDTVSVIDNGMPIEDIFRVFAEAFCHPMTIISNFFQINPDVVSNINYVTGLQTKVTALTVWQKSDVKRPNVTGNATIANLTFDGFMTWLITLFNMAWRITYDDVLGHYVLRIEHVSYWAPGIGLDLTQAKYDRYTNQMQRYSYDNTAIPSQEIFKFMEASQGDFTGYPIVYNKGCVIQPSKENDKTHTLGDLTTDVQLCITNPDSNSALVSDDGFVMMATRKYGADQYYILSETSITGGISDLNNSLAWAQLHRDYWMYERPVKKGSLNGAPTTFISVIPTKKGDKVTIPLCCGETFDPDLKVKTILGLGVVSAGSFSFKNQTLELDLLYDADEDLTTNTPPVAGNIVTAVYQPHFIDIDVLTVCSDADPDSSITSVIIEIPPTHGTAHILANNKIRYIPDDSFAGNDNIVYHVLDDWSEPSNPGLIAITVHAGNSAPVAGSVTFATLEDTELDQAAPGVFGASSDDVGFTLDTYDHVTTHGGAVVVNPDGSFTYTPPASYIGPDSFTFTIIDDQALTATGTAHINVNDPNGVVANTDNYGARKDIAKSFAAPGVLANDTTLIGSLTATAETKATTQGGTVTINTDGSFDYTPPAAYTGPDSFTYTADNGTETATGTVNIYVYPDIWVHLAVDADEDTIVYSDCGGTPTDNGGFTRNGTQKLTFFADAGGTTPIDVTGFNFGVDITRHTDTSTGAGAGPGTPSSSPYSTIEGVGIETDFVYNPIHQEFYDCVPQRVRYEDTTFTITPSADYEII